MPGQLPAASADESFANWLEAPIAVVPINDWRLYSRAADVSIYVYESANRIKVVAVFGPDDFYAGGVGILELRACEFAEFGPEAVFADGRRVWADPDGRILSDIAGPEHCGWQTGRILNLGEGAMSRQYLADPAGVMPNHGLDSPYDADAELPADASASGYRYGDLELWFVPDGRAVYVVGEPAVELWPESDPPIGCV